MCSIVCIWSAIRSSSLYHLKLSKKGLMRCITLSRKSMHCKSRRLSKTSNSFHRDLNREEASHQFQIPLGMIFGSFKVSKPFESVSAKSNSSGLRMDGQKIRMDSRSNSSPWTQVFLRKQQRDDLWLKRVTWNLILAGSPLVTIMRVFRSSISMFIVERKRMDGNYNLMRMVIRCKSISHQLVLRLDMLC